MNFIRSTQLLIGSVMLAVFFTACGPKDDILTPPTNLTSGYDSDVLFQWNELLLDIDRHAPGYRPPAASRAFAYIGLAAYEAAVPGMPDNNSFETFFLGLNLPEADLKKEYIWPVCVNAAYATMLKKLYPHIGEAYLFEILNLEKNIEDEYTTTVVGDESLERSKLFGESIANAIYGWSTTDDVGHEAYLNTNSASYSPPTGTGLWEPTGPDFTPALFPYWGQVRRFAVKDGDMLGAPPIPYDESPTSLFYQQAKEVKSTVDNLSYDNKWIAEFWSDDIAGLTFEPAARWIAIANQIVAAEKPSLDRGVELYAKLGMSMCDAAIIVWNTKYHYNVERPVSYIHRVLLDEEWKPVLDNPITGEEGITPPFPAYPSGHSGFGGAAAPILAETFGSNYTMTDRCHEDRSEFIGTPRLFESFFDMAEENAYSRIPLGVHFRMDCDEGLRLGYLAAKRVQEMPWKK